MRFCSDCCFGDLPGNPCHNIARGVFFSSQQLRPFWQRNYIEAEAELTAFESCIQIMDVRPAMKRLIGRERMKRVPYVLSQTERLRYERQGQQLLPGIPNEITLYHITPKLPFAAFGILSSVSYGWREAIQSRQVSHGREGSQSKENFALIKHGNIHKSYRFSIRRWFALYSLREKKIFRIPGIPRVASGIPDSSKCILLDDKVYVLGGHHDRASASRSVYVMDLAGLKQWERCASMNSGRIFESADEKVGYGRSCYCRIVDGKILAYEAFDYWWLTPDKWWQSRLHAEIYDPKLDVWSGIQNYPGLDFWAYNESQRALRRGWGWGDEPGNDEEDDVQRTAILNAYASEICGRVCWTNLHSEHSGCLYLKGPFGITYTVGYGGTVRL